jgi:hypothetical protein
MVEAAAAAVVAGGRAAPLLAAASGMAAGAAGGGGASRLGGMTGAEGCPGGSCDCVPYSTHWAKQSSIKFHRNSATGFPCRSRQNNYSRLCTSVVKSSVLWTRYDLLRFRFRLWKNFVSHSGSGTGSCFGSRQYLLFNTYFPFNNQKIVCTKSCLLNVRSNIDSQKAGLSFLI